MTDDDRSSFIATHLIDGLRDAMLPEMRASLAPYERLAQTLGSDRSAEWHRAFACARWAQENVVLAHRSQLVALASKAIEAIKAAGEAVTGSVEDLFALPLGIAVSADLSVETEWVYEAVHVAERIAQEEGWEFVPWEALLREVTTIGIESAG